MVYLIGWIVGLESYPDFIFPSIVYSVPNLKAFLFVELLVFNQGRNKGRINQIALIIV